MPERCGNRFDLRFCNIAEELERQVKIFFPQPANFSYARVENFYNVANFFDDRIIKVDGNKSANHDLF